mmetsp:Transcript_2364/g.8677  ORF Transcript_2364/g.8677 Transcript_2364/m.8677 type:complete len:231 (-) Transcript_2364:635-1327(-)
MRANWFSDLRRTSLCHSSNDLRSTSRATLYSSVEMPETVKLMMVRPKSVTTIERVMLSWNTCESVRTVCRKSPPPVLFGLVTRMLAVGSPGTVCGAICAVISCPGPSPAFRATPRTGEPCSFWTAAACSVLRSQICTTPSATPKPDGPLTSALILEMSVSCKSSKRSRGTWPHSCLAGMRCRTKKRSYPRPPIVRGSTKARSRSRASSKSVSAMLSSSPGRSALSTKSCV